MAGRARSSEPDGRPGWHAGRRRRRRLAPDDDETRAHHPPDTGPRLPPTRTETAAEDAEPPDQDPGPSKITVTRVAAWRTRRLTRRGVAAFHRAASADGADRSGLTALTYAWMANYASDATLAVALANTLFFSAATAESQGRVALYLLVTVAPFALIAPVIGPLLDRVQRGRRAALAVSAVGQGALAVVLALFMDTWALYPAALGIMVLSKSFGVLKAAVTPRVLPPGVGLVTTNSRLTVFGLVASGAAGAVAAGAAWVFGSPGAAWLTAAICVLGAWLCLRIPSWVEVTEGEVETTLLGRAERRGTTPGRAERGGTTPGRAERGGMTPGRAERAGVTPGRAERRGVPPEPRTGPTDRRRARPRVPMSTTVVTALWSNGTIRALTGFLMLFSAFVVKHRTEGSPTDQVLLLGLIGAAAGAGGFLGNALGARRRFDRPQHLLLGGPAVALSVVVLAAVVVGPPTAALVALVAATTSALLKVCLDAVVQRNVPEAARASAFGRSETILQLSWVFGGALGVLLPPTWWIGFTVIAGVVAVGTVQTVLTWTGRTLLPLPRRRSPEQSP